MISDIISVIKALHSKKGDFAWLDSNQHHHPESRTSFIGVGNRRVLKKMDGQIILKEGEKSYLLDGSFLDHVDDFIAHSKNKIFGYLGYDLKNEIEILSSENPTQIPVPDAYLFEPEFVVSFSPSNGIEWLSDETCELPNVEDALPKFETSFVYSNSDRQEYINRVIRCQDHIREGDCYELNLSRLISGAFSGSALHGYLEWRAKNRVPFGAFMRVEETEVMCMSPERFLARRGQVLESHPIKGTRPRKNTDHDSEIAHQLLHSEKDRAENLMIVDLVRNDLSHVCEAGSVVTKDLFEIQVFDTVFQMVSKVLGIVKSNVRFSDIIKSTFPMGSMTGAPKVRVMQLIEELENYKRGIYSGAIGYIDPTGDFDFNVVIRSVVARNGFFEMGVGGAITSDSIPEQEWEETETKAQAFYTFIESL